MITIRDRLLEGEAAGPIAEHGLGS